MKWKSILAVALLVAILRPIGYWRGDGEVLARACDDCDLNWPAERRFETCPKCGRVARVTTVRSVMTAGEAKSALKQIEFERFCRKRDVERARAGEPSPEQKGRDEARIIIELDKALGES